MEFFRKIFELDLNEIATISGGKKGKRQLVVEGSFWPTAFNYCWSNPSAAIGSVLFVGFPVVMGVYEYFSTDGTGYAAIKKVVGISVLFFAVESILVGFAGLGLYLNKITRSRG
jgi:hypothetical protein